TEIASLDALRQRFGRLDRLGLRGESRAVILAPRKSAEHWKAIERIYGEAPRTTAEWLDKIKDERGEIDFGIQSLKASLDSAAADPEFLEKLLSPHQRAPVLLPAYVNLRATTSPAPEATPEPSLFLHGPGTSPD